MKFSSMCKVAFVVHGFDCKRLKLYERTDRGQSLVVKNIVPVLGCHLSLACCE